jgi:hypothetical protein
MKMFRGIIKSGVFRVLAAVSALAAISVAPAVAATITFAQYDQSTLGQEWTLSNDGSNNITITSSGSVSMTFGNTGTALDSDSPLTANFTLNAVSSTAGSCNNTCATNDPWSENGFSGSFHFISTAFDQTVWGIPTGTNLLSGTFNTNLAQHGATLSSSEGNGSATFQDSTDAVNTTQLVFSSDIINFSGQTAENASFALTSLTPPLALTSPQPPGCGPAPLAQCTAYPSGSYTAAGDGTFATSPGFVPEPESATLIGIGLCGIAFVSRRLRSKAAARQN